MEKGYAQRVANCLIELAHVHEDLLEYDDAVALYTVARLWQARTDVPLEPAERAARVLAEAVPAVFLLDAVRYRFRDPADREHWARKIADDYAFVFRAAADGGDAGLLADLVEAAGTGRDGEGPAATLGGAVRLLDQARLRLNPPPPLVAPYGRTVLAPYRHDDDLAGAVLTVW